MLKTLETLKTDLVNMTGNVKVADFKTFLENMIDSLKSNIFYSAVTALDDTEAGLKSVATVSMVAGTLIHVNLNGVGVNYILTAGKVAADFKQFLIKPTDYADSTNEKYWIKENCKYVEITDANLNVSHVYLWSHGVGIQYANVLVINANDVEMPKALTSTANNVFITFKSANEIDLDFNATITGTYKLLLTY